MWLALQVGETEPFISELLGELTATIQDLETHQIHMFYEAVGLMISADSDAKRREQYLVRCGPLLPVSDCMHNGQAIVKHREII